MFTPNDLATAAAREYYCLLYAAGLLDAEEEALLHRSDVYSSSEAHRATRSCDCDRDYDQEEIDDPVGFLTD